MKDHYGGVYFHGNDSHNAGHFNKNTLIHSDFLMILSVWKARV